MKNLLILAGIVAAEELALHELVEEGYTTEQASRSVSNSGLAFISRASVDNKNCNCMLNTFGYDHFIGVATTSGGAFNTQVCSSMLSCFNNNMPHVDVMFVPCPTCSDNLATQFQTMLNNINSKCTSGTWSGFTWLNIEQAANWTAGAQTNQGLLTNLINWLATSNHPYGIFSSQHSWTTIFGT